MASFFHQWIANLLAPAVPVTWAAFSLLGVFAGPFGTLHAYSFELRLVFWPVLIGIAILLGALARTLVESVFGLRRFVTQAPLLAVLVTVLLAPPLHAVAWQLSVTTAAPLPSALEIVFFVFAASISVSAIRHAVAPSREPPPPVAFSPAPRILTRLPPELRASLLRLSVRDHYVDVVTGTGTASILLRFGDAIAETEGAPGAQVHRSHWVAAAAIEGAGTQSGKFVLQLVDGTRVPVSKTYRAAAEAMLAAHPVAPGRGASAVQRGIGMVSTTGPGS